jgi:hypothetical protein
MFKYYSYLSEQHFFSPFNIPPATKRWFAEKITQRLFSNFSGYEMNTLEKLIVIKKQIVVKEIFKIF